MHDISEIRASYERMAPLAARFAARLSEQVGEILLVNSISLAVPIESRVKTWPSLSEKIQRNALNVSDVVEVKDLVGLRIILLFKRDLQKVVDHLSSRLAIISTEDAVERLGVEMFGYQSIHLQAEMPGAWATVPTLKDFAGLQAEVQIRTAAQHIWAAASHKLQYKMESSVPPQVLRSVNRVAALLETVDFEFERALAERDDYVARAGASLKTDEGAFHGEALNVDLLRELLDQLLPKANADADDDFGDLLKDLESANIRQVIQFTEFIKAGLSKALKLDRKIASRLRKERHHFPDGVILADLDGMSYEAEAERVERGVFFSHAGLVREMLEQAGLADFKSKAE